MAGADATLTIKDGGAADRDSRVWDESGVGTGPFSFKPVLNPSESHVGEVGAAGDVFNVTLSLDTSAYVSGDVLADTQTLTNAVRVNGGRAILQSIQVLDEDDQGIEMDIVFLSANNSIGTENVAVSVSDGSARDILGILNIATADYVDLGGCQSATKAGIGLVLEAAGGSRDLYIAAITRGTPTHSASGIRLKLGLLWD